MRGFSRFVYPDKVGLAHDEGASLAPSSSSHVPFRANKTSLTRVSRCPYAAGIRFDHVAKERSGR